MEWHITEDEKYRIESLSAATFHGALKVIKEAFCQDEYGCRGTEINKNEVAIEEMLELCADAAIDGASLVAIHVDTGEVVAAIFNKLLVAASDVQEKPFFEIFAEERCTHASSRALVKVIVDLEGRCNFFEKFGLNCSLDLMFIATLRHHRHQKLGTLLCKTSIELAKKLKDGPVSTITVKDFGPKYAFMPDRKPVAAVPKFCQGIWTSEGTRKIGKALGFAVYMRVSFEEFSFNGMTFPEQVGKPEWCEVAALIL